MAANIQEYIPDVLSKPHILITSDKFMHEFKIEPTNDGYVFYEISVSKGKLPKVLEGNFSRMKDAIRAVLEYERKATKSPSKATKDRYDAKDASKNIGDTD